MRISEETYWGHFDLDDLLSVSLVIKAITQQVTEVSQ